MKGKRLPWQTTRIGVLVIAVFVLMFVLSPMRPVAAQGPTPKVVVREFNGDLRNLPKVKDTSNFVRPVRQPPVSTLKQPSGRAPSLPLAPHAPLVPMPSPSMSVEGLNFATNGAGWPPDTNGDVGPGVYMQGVNTSIGVFDKTTGAQITAFTYASFWAGSGTGTPCDANNQGDIIVLYDPLQDRWLFMDFAFALSGGLDTPPYYFCFAVSKTSDPVSGGWWKYAYLAQDASSNFPDYPKGGVWTDGFYFSANMFGSGGGTFKGVRLYAFDRLAMESGTLRAATKDYAYPANDVFTVLPANLRGTLPPAGRNEFFVSESVVAFRFDVWTASPDYGTGVLTVTGPSIVSQTTYTAAADPVASPRNNIDTLSDRGMVQAQYRNLNGVESLWFNHTTGTTSASTPTGSQWAQINVTGGTAVSPPVQQQIFNNGTDGLNRFMGSLAVDGSGNMALGYTAENSTTNPDIRYAGRLSSDTLSTLPQTEVSMLNGVTRESPGNNCGGAACTRWGDYSLMTVDPIDDCTFWYTNEYYLSPDTTGWHTRIGNFSFTQPSQCNPVANRASSKTNHTISFDGNAQLGNDFNYATEWLGSKGGIDYFATWDATNLYVGMLGGTLTATTGSVCPANGCTYVAVVDTDPATQSSSNTGTTNAFQCASLNTNAKGDYALSRANGVTTRNQASGGSWVAWTPTNSNVLDNGWNNTEFRFQFSELTSYTSGNPIALYLYVCDGSNLISAWPPENPQTGATPALGTTVSFATNDSGRTPRTFARHWGKQSQNASTTGLKSFFNGYFTLNVTTAGGGACTFDVALDGNMDTLDTNMIRRIYTLTPNSCTGLIGDLTLKYEDGSLVYGSSMNNAPSEIGSLNEGTLLLIRQVGSNWVDQIATSRDTTANTVTKTGVSTFSIWSLGTAHPTNVTLTSFDVSSSSGATSIELGIAALAILGVVMVLFRKKPINDEGSRS